jgi:ATP-dependent exoDNAse (exonuclease V) alpha subunit
LANKQSGFRALEGLAGTGKTSTLAVVREALEKAGYHVLGATISAKAARELQEGAGIKSHSTAGVEFRMEPPLRFRLRHHLRQMYRAIRQKPTFKLTPLKFDERTVLVLDEAAMIPTKELALLAGAVEEAGGMLITVFDRKQLQAIGPGGGAAFLADRYGKANLTNIVRQKNPMDVEFVRAFASGNAKEAIEKLEKRGLLHVAKDRASAMARLVADWTDADFGKRERALIFVGTRAEVADANARCQKARLRAGELRGHAYTHRGRTFYERDRVVFTKNSTKLGVENSAFGTIVELKRLRGIAMIKMDTGETLPIPLRRFKGYKGLELGYAVTTHKGQGTTVDSAYLLVGGKMQDRELTYVQASRARLSTRVYTDQHEAGENLFQLAKQMEKSHQKTLAHAVVADSKRGHGAGRLKKTNGDRREALARDAAAQQEREMEALRLKIRLGI